MYQAQGNTYYGGASQYGGSGASQCGGDQYHGQYAGPSKLPVYQSRAYRKSNLFEVVAGIVIPWILFAATFSLVCLPIHYTSPSACFLGCVLLAVVVLVLGWNAWGAFRGGSGSIESQWIIFIFVTSLFGFILGLWCGQYNYTTNMVPYLDVQNMNVYHSVDPSTLPGQQVMDAGRIEFVRGAQLDLTKSIGFKNLDYYCATPIAMAGARVQSYDYWAVGTNCCTGKGDFHCGEYMSGDTMSGLRLMREDQRDYFRLAVQQAEAAYNIHSKHPIFLYWMKDPLTEIEAFQDAGYKYLLLGFFAFFCWQLVSVTAAGVVFSKMSA